MLRKLLFLACTVAAAFVLSSCTSFNPVTENLMKPPRLTAEQKAIDDALHESVIAENIYLKYPNNGDYRSAFVFHDIDGDGEEEAIVFYAVDFNSYTRIALLDRTPDGTWHSIYDRAGKNRNVEFVSFANITGSGAKDILIGWSSPDSEIMELTVYTFENNALNYHELGRNEANYDAYLIDDLDRNGLDDIFLLSIDTRSDTSWIKHIAYNGYEVELMNELPLSDSIMRFAGVTAGKLSPDGAERGLFIDEALVGSTLVTEVFTLENGMLSAIISHDMENLMATDGEDAEDENTYTTPTLYELTKRTNPSGKSRTVCTDINKDKVIEIPTTSLLPTYSESSSGETDPLYLTEYNQIKNGGLVQVMAAAINYEAGYLVEFPPEWIGKVTIVNQIENNEWHFIKYNSDAGAPAPLSTELARIRVVSQKDYQDKFLDSYVKFKPSRGIFTYYGYIPENVKSSLAVDMTELEAMFALLS